MSNLKYKRDKTTRDYSRIQEEKVADLVGGRVVKGSGSGMFAKGDVVSPEALYECKTKTKPSKSHSLKKEWFDKVRKEALFKGKEFAIIAFDYGDSGDQYFAMHQKDFLQLLACYRELQELINDED